ncbi:hypothetical protein ABPG73_006698 [Tetrahymena malaccensis]
MSDQENLNLMCPIHKRKVLYLVLDGKSDPFVLKCDICQVQKNFQNPILIEDLLQSDDSTIFRNWPIQKNLYTYKKLEQLDEISKWFDDKKENIIDDLFTDFKNTNLNESDIKNICETLKDCKEITDLQLDLSDNYVGVEGAICIATAISKYKNIMKLHFNLESNQFGDEGVSKISSAISQYQNITELGLFFMDNNVSSKGVQEIEYAIQKFKKLSLLAVSLKQKQLIMDIINIEMSDKEILNQICPVHKRTVISLGLDDKNDPQVMKCIQCQEYKTPQSSIYIEDLLQSDNTTIFRNWPIQEDHNCYRQLKQLDDISKWFSDSKEKQIDDFFTEFKSRIIQKIDNIKKDNLKKLERINEINNNNIGVEGAISIAAAISQYKDIYLLVLNLRKCQINSYGVKVILNSIQNYEKITSLTLDFRSNTFGDEGVSKIINAIKNWDQGVVYLSKAIQNCQNISTLVLVLGNNQISDYGVKCLFDSITKCQNIFELQIFLQETQITVEGALSIINQLEKINNIKSLHINLKLNNLTAVDQDTLKYSFEMLKAKIPELCQLDI